MTSPTTTRFAPMCLYEPLHQMSMWGGGYDTTGSSAYMVTGDESRVEDRFVEFQNERTEDDGQASKSISEKMQRRQAQNREAARKSRMRKKAYVQELETARLKLAQLELELERARQHGLLIAAVSTPNMSMYGTVNSGISAFEMEYGQWLDEQEKKQSELRSLLLLQSDAADRLGVMVENVLNHYCNLFRMKKDASRFDAFYLVSGAWRTSVERFFLWIGGFRPSELISVVKPHLGELSDHQNARIDGLKGSCVQAEDALSQGIEKLQVTLSQSTAFLAAGAGNYSAETTASAMEKLEALESFVHQADHLREQTLHQMSRILTTQQAAKGLVAFGEYFIRLRALSVLWTARCPNNHLQKP